MEQQPQLQQETLFGIPLISATLDHCSEALAQYACTAPHVTSPTLIAHADVHVLTRALRDEQHYGAGLRQFDYICPDGMPLVWMLQRKRPLSQRIYGPDMMEQMCDKGRKHQLRHYLLGGSNEALEKLQKNLQQRYPELLIAGSYSPPMGTWTEEENKQIAQQIQASQAHCVWVALGCPKQETWLFEHRQTLPPALYFAVGAAFNFHAGLVDQAPQWIRQRGLEWLYRLIKEPRRLFKRYLIHNSLFIWYFITKKH